MGSTSKKYSLWYVAILHLDGKTYKNFTRGKSSHSLYQTFLNQSIDAVKQSNLGKVGHAHLQHDI